MAGEDPLLEALERLENLAELQDRLEKVERRLGRSGDEGSIEALRAEAADLGQIAESVVALSQRLEEIQQAEAQAESGGEGPWWWPDLTPEEAGEAWTTLVPWVDALKARYSESDGDAIRACWFAHPDAVDELSALYWAWKAAYKKPNPAGTAALDWVGRGLVNVTGRVRQLTSSCNGSDGCPRLRGIRSNEVTSAQRKAFIEADLASRRPNLRPV